MVIGSYAVPRLLLLKNLSALDSDVMADKRYQSGALKRKLKNERQQRKTEVLLLDFLHP